jgi:hypothetical protein
LDFLKGRIAASMSVGCAAQRLAFPPDIEIDRNGDDSLNMIRLAPNRSLTLIRAANLIRSFGLVMLIHFHGASSLWFASGRRSLVTPALR